MKLLIPVCGICIVLALIGGPGYYSPRSLQYGWNLGHIFLFALLTYLLLNLWGRIASKPFLRQCCLIFVVTLCLGIAIELVQFGLSGRSPDFGDIIRNFVGCLVTLSFLATSRSTLSKRRLRLLQGITILAFLMEVVPLTIALTDEEIARQQFPVLSDFETPFEMDRWTGSAEIAVDRKIARHGTASLVIHLTSAHYSGSGLKYFPGDWSDYKFLRFSVFNPSAVSIKVVCRVHDSLHFKKGGKYEDRFNRTFVIDAGWNDIEIPLEDIAKAPKNRPMEMSRIEGFGIFTVRLPTPQTINIDYLRLSK